MFYHYEVIFISTVKCSLTWFVLRENLLITPCSNDQGVSISHKSTVQMEPSPIKTVAGSTVFNRLMLYYFFHFAAFLRVVCDNGGRWFLIYVSFPYPQNRPAQCYVDERQCISLKFSGVKCIPERDILFYK